MGGYFSNLHANLNFDPLDDHNRKIPFVLISGRNLGLFLGILAAFFIINLITVVPNIVIMGELTLFFIIYAKFTTT
jgi:hypothetical protein